MELSGVEWSPVRGHKCQKQSKSSAKRKRVRNNVRPEVDEAGGTATQPVKETGLICPSHSHSRGQRNSNEFIP